MYKTLRKIAFATIFTLCISHNGKAQTYVLIPDGNFAAYLQGLIPSAMSGNSLNITSTLVTTATQSIIVSSMLISNLSGIQYFTSLTLLYCNDNFLTSLPALPNSLTMLYCSNNSLTSLPPLPNSLTYLNCYLNTLTNLPALPNSLTTLVCADNPLTSLPALPSSLTALGCSNNSLTSLPSLPNSLTSLACYNNSLTSLPSLPNSLNLLSCANNNISCFPVFPALLQFIYLSPNPFTCLPNYVLPAMNAYTTTPLCVAGNTNGCAVIGLKELNPENIQISLYPNPSKSSFSIKIDNEINNGELILINSIGQTVYTSELKRGENKITSGITSSGLHQYIILQNKQPLSRGKLVIE